MNKEYDLPVSHPAPELSMALWSIRFTIARDTRLALSLLQKWGVKSVEVPGFFGYRADDFQRLISDRHMTVCSMIAPPVTQRRNLRFYREWVDEYLPVFEPKELVLMAAPEMFGIIRCENHLASL